MLLPIRCSTFSSRTSRPRLEISEVPPGGFLVLLTWSLFLCLFRGQSRERFSGKIYQYIISSCLYFKFNIRVIISVSLVFYIYIYLSPTPCSKSQLPKSSQRTELDYHILARLFDP